MVPSLPIAGEDFTSPVVMYFHFVEFVCDPLYCDRPVFLLSWWNLGCGEVARLAAETAPERIIDPKNINPKNKTILPNLDRFSFIKTSFRSINVHTP